MNAKVNHERDECLERLWHRRELGIGAGAAAGAAAVDSIGDECIRVLSAEGLADIGADGQVAFSPEGERRARQLVRSHRLAERLVQDVLGQSAESSACEFEHLLGTEVVDAICTLLGHPRECPHGMPIPEGECCRQRAQLVERTVVPLPELTIGESARIAYVNAQSDSQLHRLDNLLLRPGETVKLHQRRPSFVVECENSMSALDDAVAASIHVWVGSEHSRAITPRGRRRQRRGFRHSMG